MLSQEQFSQYKKYYDFALELFNNSQKMENNNSSVLIQKPVVKDVPSYNNYFEPKQKEKSKKQDR